jgi:hypothetical protein
VHGRAPVWESVGEPSFVGCRRPSTGVVIGSSLFTCAVGGCISLEWKGLTMPTQISCPNCDVSLNLPDTVAGKKVKCPKCSTPFVAPEAEVLEVVQPAAAVSPAPATAAAPAANASIPPAVQAQPAAPVQAAVAQSSPVLSAPGMRCAQCGFQGYMPRRWASWVVPTAVISGLFTGFGFLLLLVPKQHRCPQCGAAFG